MEMWLPHSNVPELMDARSLLTTQSTTLHSKRPSTPLRRRSELVRPLEYGVNWAFVTSIHPRALMILSGMMNIVEAQTSRIPDMHQG